MNTRHLISLIGMVAVCPLLAQTPPTLPGSLLGQYSWQSNRSASKTEVILVELSQITTDGENVNGIVSTYRSPAGNCVSDNTAFRGTYRDGVISIRSGNMKSNFVDGRPCGGIAIEAKMDGRGASGTMKVGSAVFPVELAAK